MAEANSGPSASILLVEDEVDLLELLRFNLEREGYEVFSATTGEEAVKIARQQIPDLLVLDLMLPGMDGLEVARTLKSRQRTESIPIVMLTARGEEADIVKGLESGADDYVTKPFSPRVLLARIVAVLRRQQQSTPGEKSPIIQAGELMMDLERHEVTVSEHPVTLTATEFKLLALMAARPGRVFTRQQIISSIHEGYAAVTDRSVDVQVVALRRKLGEAGNCLETVRGVGYRFQE